MAEVRPYQNHLRSASDLITPSTETRAGFVSMALEKNFLAVPYVEEAKALKVLASKAESPDDLIEFHDLRLSLLTASGLSDKSLGYLTDEDKTKAIKGLIENFLVPAGEDFVNELVYRYLLIKGDALGGKARNLAGTLGERKLTRSLISILNLTGIQYFWLDEHTCTWAKKPENDAGIERSLKGLFWEIESKQRVLLLNMKVPVVGNNVDLCLLNGHMGNVALLGDTRNSLHRKSESYIALGELKGGIDPAGADEHWKTANSALGRIKLSFENAGMSPSTLFIGAAIQSSMAAEIYTQLTNETLTNAANLTNDSQLTSILTWLISL